MPSRLYLDVCCFNRPFDDWSQSRIRLEAEAILAILEQCQISKWSLVSSTAIESEIERTLDPIRKQRLIDSLAIASERVTVTESIMIRASDLKNFGFQAFDALHVACAEFAEVDALLTTDDRLLRRAITRKEDLVVCVTNPVTWFMEATDR